MRRAVARLMRRAATARASRLLERLRARLEAASPTVRGMLWTSAAGLTFSVMNAVMRTMSLQLDPLQTQFLRFAFGVVVMLPLVLRVGLGRFRPNGFAGQVGRGLVHTAGLVLWFLALPHLPLADVTAMGFTGPIFVMLGAAWFFGERMVAARWVAALIGFAGVLIVVWPRLQGSGGGYALMMLASAPMFAASTLITKALTRRDSPAVIVVWQALMVAAFSAPLAMVNWEWPTPGQWVWFAICGVLGSFGNYCVTRSYYVADVSATQPVKFFDLVWASILGLAVFGDWPSVSTLAGGAVILASTVWIARRESRRAR